MTPDSPRIILTGASEGIGRSIALHYARRGARLVLVARRREMLEDVARDVKELGGEALVCDGDVRLRETAVRAYEMAVEGFGGVDIAIMNAGRGGPTFVDNFSGDEARQVMETNWLSAVWMVEAVLPSMRTRRSGQIVAIGSLAGYRGMPGSGPYNASKSALHIFIESLRVELRTSGVKMLTIAPGFVRTSMTAPNEFHMPWLMEPERAAAKIVRAIDRGRSLYRFPLGTSLSVRLLQWLPNWIYDRLIGWGRKAGARIEKRELRSEQRRIR